MSSPRDGKVGQNPQLFVEKGFVPRGWVYFLCCGIPELLAVNSILLKKPLESLRVPTALPMFKLS
jgi:hypothetical protein